MSEENSVETKKKAKPRARRSYQKDLADLTGRVNVALVLLSMVEDGQDANQIGKLVLKAMQTLKGES